MAIKIILLSSEPEAVTLEISSDEDHYDAASPGPQMLAAGPAEHELPPYGYDRVAAMQKWYWLLSTDSDSACDERVKRLRGGEPAAPLETPAHDQANGDVSSTETYILVQYNDASLSSGSEVMLPLAPPPPLHHIWGGLNGSASSSGMPTTSGSGSDEHEEPMFDVHSSSHEFTG